VSDNDKSAVKCIIESSSCRDEPSDDCRELINGADMTYCLADESPTEVYKPTKHPPDTFPYNNNNNEK